MRHGAVLPAPGQKVLLVRGPVGAHAVAILHQDGLAKAPPGCLARVLAIGHAFGIGRAPVPGVATRLRAEVHAKIAGVVVLGRLHCLGVGAVLAHKAFEAGAGREERADDGEMFITGPGVLARPPIGLGEEEFGHVGGEDALVVLGEDAVIEAAPAELAVQKPEPGQVIAHLLAEEPLAAHVVEGGHHMGLEPLFGREAGSAVFFVDVIEEGREFLEDGIGLAFAGAPRMVRWDGGIEVEDGEEIGLRLGIAAHTFRETVLSASCSHSCKTFSTAC